MHPRFPVARRQLFGLRLKQKRYDDALAVAEKLLGESERQPDSFLVQVADAYQEAGRVVDGVGLFTTSMERGNWWAGTGLARLLLHAGETARADATARAVLAREPNNEAAMVTVFQIAQAQHRLDSVRPMLEAALDVQPRSVMFLNWLSIVYESAGEMPKAEGLLLRALEANPDHSGSMANLGAFYSRHDRIPDAIRLLERALRIDPENIDARINLGSAFARTGRLRKAIAEYERAVDSGVEQVVIYNSLAKANAQIGDIESAIRWLERSLELDPDQEGIPDTLNQLKAMRR
jgi:tetratricopeptide (TPR) repeat protein